MARNIDYNINVDADRALSTVGQLEDNLGMLMEELRGVDRDSQAFVTLSARIQATTDELERANAQIEGFSSQRRRMALQGTIDIFAGGIEAASGLAAALGLGNEEFEAVVTNLLAVQSAANGIRTLTAGFFDLREALRGVTVAQLRFNAAALANPYVAAAVVIVAAITSVVAQFDEFQRCLLYTS
ncbi:MAG: hypothetical protein MPK62_11025, partial [Alphaproteobacteria bacterium]|nr:hypothetical protein [Alphaproteobacteria bacterium]